MNTPLLLQLIPAGFPVPEQPELSGDELNLHSYVVKNPVATYFMRVSGTSMKDVGIFDGDIVAVDRSITPKSGDTVVAVVDGDFTLKKLSIQQNKPSLVPANEAFKTIHISDDQELQVWGVVTFSIKKFR